MKNKKISSRVLIIRNAYQEDTGGAEQYAFNLALGLKRAGLTPIVITKHVAILQKCRDNNILCLKGVWRDRQEWTRLYYLFYPVTVFWYIYVILRFRVNIVHAQSRDDFVFATRAAKLLHKKAIWTDHADLKYIMDRVNRPHPRMQRWILNASQYTSTIMCVSKSEKTEVETVAPELSNKLRIVYNGVFVPEQIQPKQKSGFVVGTNSRLVPNKGIDELLEGFAEFNQKSSELWIVGGYSGNKQKYEDIARKLGISDRIKLIGYVSNPDDFVASMDIFVHASYHEAFSLAIVEAAMLGRPIIATNVGGTPEIIDKSCGVLIPAKNSGAISKNLNMLFMNPKKVKKLGQAAKKRALTQFNFEKIIDKKIIPIYGLEPGNTYNA